MQANPQFFLTTAGEYGPLAEPRACWVLDCVQNETRDDYMLVRIDPSLVGQQFGLGHKDITELILATRHEGYSLFPIGRWPAHVYVVRVIDDSVLRMRRFSRDQIELIAWGMLFCTFDEALAEAKRFRNVTIQTRTPKGTTRG